MFWQRGGRVSETYSVAITYMFTEATLKRHLLVVFVTPGLIGRNFSRHTLFYADFGIIQDKWQTRLISCWRTSLNWKRKERKDSLKDSLKVSLEHKIPTFKTLLVNLSLDVSEACMLSWPLKSSERKLFLFFYLSNESFNR